jgi:hypothetical protein
MGCSRGSWCGYRGRGGGYRYTHCIDSIVNIASIAFGLHSVSCVLISKRSVCLFAAIHVGFHISACFDSKYTVCELRDALSGHQ